MKYYPNILPLLFGLFVTIGAIACQFFGLNDVQDDTLPCPPLPENFKEADLVGSWVANYFENTDRLDINANGTYKQVYSSSTLSFENNVEDWYIEYTPEEYALLHLRGMRRCDDIASICNTSGGGLPTNVVAINPCTSEYLTYSNEVILFVTGYSKDLPRGIVLRHAKLAGSDWTFGFKLVSPQEP